MARSTVFIPAISLCLLTCPLLKIGALPIKAAVIPEASQSRTFWDDGAAKLTIAMRCAAQRRIQNL